MHRACYNLKYTCPSTLACKEPGLSSTEKAVWKLFDFITVEEVRSCIQMWLMFFKSQTYILLSIWHCLWQLSEECSWQHKALICAVPFLVPYCSALLFPCRYTSTIAYQMHSFRSSLHLCSILFFVRDYYMDLHFFLILSQTTTNIY